MIAEDILDDIVTTLAAVNTDTYNNRCALATREGRNWTDLESKELPAAIVMLENDEKDVHDTQGEHVVSTMTVIIQGVVKGGGDYDQRQKLWAADIEKALAVDGTRDSSAWYTDPANCRYYTLPRDTPRAVFDYTFIIKYNYIKGSP